MLIKRWSVCYSVVAAAVLVSAQGAHATLRAQLDASHHRLIFYEGDKVTHTYKARLGFGGIGKCRAGDKRTPLGSYTLSPAKRSASFRWFLPVGYPNAQDRANHCTGGDIGLHGTGNLLRRKLAQAGGIDWTLGCIAVANKDIDEIRRMVAAPIQLTITR